MFGSTQAAAPVLPPETANQQSPDGGVVKSSAERRTASRVSGAFGGFGGNVPTILTSAKGVTSFAPTEKKTLLGQ